MTLALAVFAVLVLVLASSHDVWRDEVRAFSVATRAPTWLAMFRDLREEGHPAVWYAILRAGFAVTNSPLVLPVAAALAGIGAAALALRFAPFTLLARISIVFGALLGYELTIVARNYGIGVLFMFGACALFRQRSERPALVALMLALMANTSVHAAAASGIILLIWVADLSDDGRHRELLAPATVASIVFVLAAIVFALWTARPPEEMAYAVSLSQLNPGAIAKAALIDPGLGLRGTGGANILAANEIPWMRIGLDAETVSRVLVNLTLLWLLWSLRRNTRALVAIVLAIVAFEIIFRLIYTGGLRHEALLAMLLVSICWIAIAESPPGERAASSRRITRGLAPLLLVQSLALPFVAWRHIEKPESMAPQLAYRIRSNPEYRNAILMSEPDPLMETLTWYVDNPVYMPRQREFDYRAWFDKGAKRQRTLTLAQLVGIADSVSCAERRPVLLSVGYRRFFARPDGEIAGPYGSVFRWTAAEKASSKQRMVLLPYYAGATSDENYQTFYMPLDSACRL